MEFREGDDSSGGPIVEMEQQRTVQNVPGLSTHPR